MKRRSFLCLLLAVLLGLTACTPAAEESGAPSSADSDALSGEASAPEESGPTTEPFEPVYRTVVSRGKPYTGPTAVDSYPDTYGSELTDGLYAEGDLGYSDPRWSDYGKPDPLTFTIDLGEIVDRIYMFEISYYHEIGPGIATPQGMRVEWSADGEAWDGSLHIPRALDEETGAYRVYGELEHCVSARYVRFVMSRYAANLFLDELSVIADVAPADGAGALAGQIEAAYAADDYDYAGALAALSSGKPVKDKAKTSLSVGRSYTLSRAAGSKFPDGGRLTDGRPTGSTYESGSYVGFDGSEALEVTLDLGGVQTDVSRFEVSLYANATLGVLPPVYVDVYAAADNDFTKVGRVYAPMNDVEGCITYTLALPETVEARRVRFSFPEQERGSLMLEELSVYAYRDAAGDGFESFYREEPIRKVESEKLFPSTDGDYSERINLIAGRGQTIYSYCPLPAGTAGNSPESSPLLTDGKRASTPSYTDSAYFKFGSGEGRDVVYDLGATATVDGFTLSFLRETPVGINSISSVLFYLSENGVDWYAVKAAVLPSEQDTEFLRYDYKLDETYKARFARFSFRVWPNAYCDELEVWGTKKVDGSSVPLSASGIEPRPLDAGGYAERDTALGGANDIVLVPNYSAADEREGRADAGYQLAEILPYAAYLDREGGIVDTMFDGFLFCPTGTGLDGGHFYDDASMAEIRDMYEKTFAADRDVAALDEAVGLLKQALGNSEYKAKYYLTLAYPGEGVSFGDLNGDGQTDRLETLDDRIAAMRWAVDLILAFVNGQSYENIEFAGFYWTHEAMNENEDDCELINTVADYTHEKGYELFWIPFYKASGFDAWHAYGFDIACMQPNYAFDANVGAGQLTNCAIMAKRLGMCVEMELMGATLTDKTYFDKYMGYLTEGVTQGYMTETVHIYYQDILAYYNACYAKDDMARLVYTYTYDFIKGRLNTAPEREPDSHLSAEANKPLSGTFNESASTARTYRIETSPANGSVTLAPDGKFTYYPQNGFTGADSFTYVISNHLGESTATTVTVSVE